MTRKSQLVALSVLGSALLAGSAIAGNNPVDEPWWPSEFGANDQMGASQYITPEKRIEAAKLVKKGKMALLGMPYSNHMPLVPGRTFALSIPGMPTHGPLPWKGEGFAQTFMDELVTGEIGQVGTQWDSLAHPMIRIQGKPGWKDGNYFYNGVRLEDVGTPRGMKKNGPENAGGFFTRGIMIDIAALKNVERLPKGYAITLADYKAALARQGTGDATKGDVVLIRTGWSQLWNTNHLGRPAGEKVKSDEQIAKDNAEFGSGEPGLAPEVCEYLAGKKISMVGSDTWGLEAIDFSKGLGEEFAYCHMNLVARRGITNFENLDLEQLS
ncbi:MAG: cyclase family protein, partial [Betaproteobacteria bacterium]